MKCPFCGFLEDKVVDSRESKDGDSIRRRRECLECGGVLRLTSELTKFRIWSSKKTASAKFSSATKLCPACCAPAKNARFPPRSSKQSSTKWKKRAGFARPRTFDERNRQNHYEAPQKLDKVAYVRFASVYLEFEDVSEFMTELKYLVRSRDKSAERKRKKAEKKKIFIKLKI
jgi:transcriptional repressor NrdR